MKHLHVSSYQTLEEISERAAAGVFSAVVKTYPWSAAKCQAREPERWRCIESFWCPASEVACALKDVCALNSQPSDGYFITKIIMLISNRKTTESSKVLRMCGDYRETHNRVWNTRLCWSKFWEMNFLRKGLEKQTRGIREVRLVRLIQEVRGKQHWQPSRNRGRDWWSQFCPGSQDTNSWRGKKGQISRRVHGTPVYTRQKIPRINHWPWSNNASLFCLRCRGSGQREHSSDQSSYCPCPRTYEADSDKVPEGKGHLPALHIRACQNSTVEETGYSKVTFSHKKNSNLVSHRLRPSSGRGPDGWNVSVLSVRDQILKRRAEEAEIHHPYF